MELTAGTMVTPNVRLVELLGAGGMGSVWIADHLTLDSQVAVKFVSPEVLAEFGSGAMARFRREAKAAAKIQSPHVVQVHDQGVMEDGTPYIVMERLHGQSLAARLEQAGPVSLREAAVILRQVAKVLTEAHELEIIHRDIKPDNIFLTRSGDEMFIKVLDFGIAKLRSTEPGAVVTATGAMVGTPFYCSPEQMLCAGDVDFHTDLWSLGVVAYELLTGQPPFLASDSVRHLEAMMGGDLSPPSAARHDVGPAVDGWFRKALARYPDQRFDSATEMVEAFDAAIGAPDAALSAPDLADAGSDAHFAATAPTEASSDGLFEAAASHAATPKPPAQVGTLAGAASSRGATGGGQRKMVAVAASLIAAVGLVGAALWFIQRGPQGESSPAAPTAPEPLISSTATAAGSAAVGAPATAAPDVPEELVLVPAGTYGVGCDEPRNHSCWPDEKPHHEVEIERFAIMRREVTVAQYRECLEQHACPTPETRKGCTHGQAEQDNLPINCVTWEAARSYCAHRGWRLPSEFEWEIAARGAELHDYPWGDETPTCGHTVMAASEAGGCGTGGLLAVGSRRSDESWIHAQDLGGSLREWTASRYDAYPNGTADEQQLGKLVTRGGSWIMKPGEVATSHTRAAESADAYRTDLGFRCAVNL